MTFHLPIWSTYTLFWTFWQVQCRELYSWMRICTKPRSFNKPFMTVITRLYFHFVCTIAVNKGSKINFAWKLCFNIGISLSKYKEQNTNTYVQVLHKSEGWTVLSIWTLSLVTKCISSKTEGIKHWLMWSSYFFFCSFFYEG